MNKESEKTYEQLEKRVFRIMATELAVVTVVIVAEVFFAARVGMSLSQCLASLALGVLIGAGLDALRGRWRRHADR